MVEPRGGSYDPRVVQRRNNLGQQDWPKKTRIEGQDGNMVGDIVVMNRGREYDLSARLESAGVYQMICSTHALTMTAEIVVLPRP